MTLELSETLQCPLVFCFLDGLLILGGISVQKTAKTEHGRVMILSSKGKSMHGLVFLGEGGGAEFSCRALSCPGIAVPEVI